MANDMEPSATHLLMFVCCIAWTMAYLFALIRGYLDKTSALPLPAIIANVTWESLYCTVFRSHSPVGAPVSAVWLLLDLGLLAIAVRYWRHPSIFLDWGLYVVLVLIGFATSLGILYYAQVEGVDYLASAFPQNLMMSILFFNFILFRQGPEGQSFYVAVFKAIGTMSAIVLASMPIASVPMLNLVTFGAILFFDFLYLWVLFCKLKRLGIPPWKRA